MFSFVCFCQYVCSQGAKGAQDHVQDSSLYLNVLKLFNSFNRATIDLFKLVHYEAQIVIKWAVSIQLKCLLVMSCSTYHDLEQ